MLLDMTGFPCKANETSLALLAGGEWDSYKKHPNLQNFEILEVYLRKIFFKMYP